MLRYVTSTLCCLSQDATCPNSWPNKCIFFDWMNMGEHDQLGSLVHDVQPFVCVCVRGFTVCEDMWRSMSSPEHSKVHCSLATKICRSLCDETHSNIKKFRTDPPMFSREPPTFCPEPRAGQHRFPVSQDSVGLAWSWAHGGEP